MTSLWPRKFDEWLSSQIWLGSVRFVFVFLLLLLLPVYRAYVTVYGTESFQKTYTRNINNGGIFFVCFHQPTSMTTSRKPWNQTSWTSRPESWAEAGWNTTTSPYSSKERPSWVPHRLRVSLVKQSRYWCTTNEWKGPEETWWYYVIIIYVLHPGSFIIFDIFSPAFVFFFFMDFITKLLIMDVTCFWWPTKCQNEQLFTGSGGIHF